jgi:hypothetical protein
MVNDRSASVISPFLEPRPPLGARIRLAVAGLLLLHFVLAVGSKFEESTTSDEVAHLTGGFTYWHFDDYRLHAENGNLPQRWAAIPTTLAGAKFPDLAGNDYWRTSDVWVLAHQFFYETGEDHFPRLMAGRAMIALFSVATGMLVFGWSHRLFGVPGGLVSLAFFTFSPLFLAHGALVTSDGCMAFFFLAGVTVWWWHLHDSRYWVGALSCLVFGLAQVAKFSGVLLLPMMAVMAVLCIFSGRPLCFGRFGFVTWWGKLGALAVSTAAHALVAAAVIWAFYGFRFSAFNPALPPGQFVLSWESMTKWTGLGGKVADFLAAAHLLPEAFLYGFVDVIETTKARAAFLNGAYSTTGWVVYFPWAFLLKTTPALLVGLALAVGIILRRWASAAWSTITRDLSCVAPLITLFTLYWAFSLTSHLNIGHRHLMPVYPVLFIVTGALGTWWKSGKWSTAGVLLLVGWQGLTAFHTWPHYLAYFNELAGGPENGWRHLVDSSLDWGQDLPRLKKWLDRNAADEPVYLAYFGTGEPDYYAIKANRTDFLNGFKFPVVYVPLKAGIYCVSATLLQQVYGPARGLWTINLEREYQQLRALEPVFARFPHDAAIRSELEQAGMSARFQRDLAQYDRLRFARLCYYLRVRHQDADIGHSIFVYRLTAEEVAQATAGSLSDWSTLIEKTVTQP